MQFEMLVLDPGKKTRCENALSLLFALRSFSRLWKSPAITENHHRIDDGQSSLVVRDQSARSTSEPAAKPPMRAFSVTLSGEFDDIESLRLPVLSNSSLK